MSDFHATEKALRQAEKALEKNRLAIASARAVVESHQATMTELEGRKAGMIRTAGAQGKLPALGEIQHLISDAERKYEDAKTVLTTLEQAEQDAARSLAVTEKQAQDALRDSWDVEADRAREELVRVAGPLLAAYAMARRNGNNPMPLAYLLRSPDLRQDIESAAEQTDVTFDVNLPEHVESSPLTHEQRSTGLHRAA